MARPCRSEVRDEYEEYLKFRREAELYRTGKIKKLIQAYYEILARRGTLHEE